MIGSDGRRRVIGTSQDMTERFQRVEAERANRAKDEFISRMSHELRTPLNAVLGFGQLVSMSELDERQRGNVEHILSAGRHLLDLINEILDISRIESGDMRLSIEPVSLPSVVVDTVDLVGPEAAEHRISLEVDETPDLWVRADVQRLRQVLLNLLSNAVKYNADGGHVWVRTRPHDGWPRPHRGAGRRAGDRARDGRAAIQPVRAARRRTDLRRGHGARARRVPRDDRGDGWPDQRQQRARRGRHVRDRTRRGVGADRDRPRGRLARRQLLSSPALVRRSGDPGPAPAPITVLCVDDNPANIELVEQILAARPQVRLLTARDGVSGLQVARDEFRTSSCSILISRTSTGTSS